MKRLVTVLALLFAAGVAAAQTVPDSSLTVDSVPPYVLLSMPNTWTADQTFNSTIGVGTAAGNALVGIGGTYTSANANAITINPTIVSSVTATQIGFSLSHTFNPSGVSLTNIRSVQVLPTLTGALNINSYNGIRVGVNTATGYSGTVTDARAFTAANPAHSGSSLPYTNYEAFITDSITNGNGITAGTVNNTGLFVSAITAAAASGGTASNSAATIVMPSGSGAGTNVNVGLSITGTGPATGAGTNTESPVLVSTTEVQSAGTVGILTLANTINQSGSAGFTELLINPTLSSTGSGTNSLIVAQTGSATRFSVDTNGAVSIGGAPSGLTVGTSDGATYCLTGFVYGGNSHVSRYCGQTTTTFANATAKTVITVPNDGGLITVCGSDGTNKFCDLVNASLVAVQGICVTTCGNIAGVPAVRTYTNAGAGAIQLALATGAASYNVNANGIVAGQR